MLPTCRGRTLSRSPKTAQPTPAQNGRHLEHRTRGPSQPPTPASIAQRRAQPRPPSHPPAPVHLLRRLQRRPVRADPLRTIFNLSPSVDPATPPPTTTPRGPRKTSQAATNSSSPTPPPQSLPRASIHSAAPCRTGPDMPHLGQVPDALRLWAAHPRPSTSENTYLGRSRRRIFAQPA